MRGLVVGPVVVALALAVSGCGGSGGSAGSPKDGDPVEKSVPIVGDVDGDGLGDIVGSGNPGEGTKVLRSDGKKLVSGDPGDWGEWTETVATVVCDFDADGKLDTAQIGSGGYVVFYQSGETSNPLGLTTGDQEWQLFQTFCGDFDGDDLVDVAFAAGNPKQPSKVRAYVVKQTSSGAWEEPQQWIEMPLDKRARSVDFEVGDWDGDNRSDLLLGSVIDPVKVEPGKDGASLALTGVPALSTGAAFELGTALKVTDMMLHHDDRPVSFGDTNGMKTAVADVDGDGADELVKVGMAGWHDTYSLTDNDWDIVQTSQGDFEGDELFTAASSNVDGDSFGDVVALNRDGKVVVYLGSEDGLADGVEWSQLAKNETIANECAFGAASLTRTMC